MPRKLCLRVCAVCNRSFEGDVRAAICLDPACRKARLKQSQQKAYAKRVDANRSASHGQGGVPVVTKTFEAARTPPVGMGLEKARPPAAQVPTQRLPWAISGVCEAVALGVSSAPAQKLGVFYVVRYGYQDYKVFIPRQENRLPMSASQKVILTVRLNERGKWALRPRETIHA